MGVYATRHTSLQKPLVDLGLSATCFAEQLRLIVGGLYLQEISFVTALEETSTSFGILDEIKLTFFKLECIDIISCVDITAVEEELMSRNREQRLGEFLDLGQKKILDILTGQNDRGLFLTHSLRGVSDIFDCREIGEEEVQLIDGGCCVSFREELVVHIREDVEQHRILELLVCIHETLNAKADEFVIADVCVTVKEFAFSTNAHGVESKAEFTKEVFGEERLRAFLVFHILIFHDGVQVCHDGIVGSLELVVIGVIVNAKLSVEPCQKDFECIDLSVIEILIDSEEVFEVGDVLGETSRLAECFGSIIFHIIGVVRPLLGFKRIDDILATHEVNVATSEVIGQILILLFRVKAEDGFAGHSRVGKNELEKIRLTLSGVTEDEDVGVRLVIASSIEVHDDVRSELISTDIESVGIRLTRIVKRIAVCNSRCWQDSFKLCTEYVVTAWHTCNESFFLSEGESVHRELFSRHLH